MSAGRRNRLAFAGRAVKFGATAAAFGLAIITAWQSASLFRLDLVFTHTEAELSFWGRGAYQPTEAARERTGQELDWLLARAPAHPDYLALAAYYYAWLAYQEDDPTVAQGYAREAVSAQYAAQQSRPAYRQGWAKMVGYATRANGAEAQLKLAEQRMELLQ